MDIQFTAAAQPFDVFGVVVRASVDGQMVTCYFNRETLQEVDPATKQIGDAVSNYNRNKAKLNAVAAAMIRDNKVVHHRITITQEDVKKYS
jgi:hypothetical protein